MVKVFRGSPLHGCPYMSLYTRSHPKAHFFDCTSVTMPKRAVRYTLTRTCFKVFDAGGNVLTTVYPKTEFVL